jgi:hypothetical protein
MSFSLFGAFGNNAFSSATFSTGGNPNFGQQNPVQGTIPSQGATTGVYSTQGLWNPWQGSFPSQGMSVGGNPFHTQWNPRKGSVPMPVGSAGGIPYQGPWNTTQGEIPAQAMSSNFGSQSMMPQQTQFPFVGQGHSFYQNPGQQSNFSGNLVPVKIQGPLFL